MAAAKKSDSDDLSSIEQLILLAVLRLRPTAYGVNIRDEIEQRGGRSISTGSLYVALERLEGRGYLRSEQSEPIVKRGGKRKQYFDITLPGSHALSRSLNAVAALSEGLLGQGAGLLVPGGVR